MTSRLKGLLAALLLWLGMGLATAAEQATLNLKDADIRVLIDTVAAITQKNFIVDPRVKARVTVVSKRPLKPEEVYEVFLSILQVHGFAAVPVGDVIKIVPDVNAKQGPVPVADARRPGRGDELVTRVVHIDHVPAAQLVPILRPLIPQQGQLAAYQPSNILLISDRAANIERLVRIIRRIDRPDQSDIEVIRLENAPAAEVARTLTALQRRNVKGAAMPGQPVITADERTNSILISGDRANRLRLRGIIAHLDTPMDNGGDTQVVFLKYARAKDLVQILTGVSQSRTRAKVAAARGKPPAGNAQRKDISIQADEANNALVITAPPAIQQELRQVITQLDVRRAQVLVEAIVAEVSLDLAKDLGVALAATGVRSNGETVSPAFVTNLGNLTSTVLGLTQGAVSQLPGGALIGGGDLRQGHSNWAVLLKALASDAATNILSTPTLVTMDNEEAEIQVGQEVPFVTGRFTNTGATQGAVNPFQTIERKDVGLTLKVKPQINEGDAVKLEIQQESSALASTSVSTADVVTNKRTIKTTVLAEDGQVIVLGGLIDDNFRDSQEKVPVLGDVPILGHLFRFNSTTKVKRSLMVFIRPVILRDAATADAYTRRKYSAFQARQLDAGIARRGLIRDRAAVLPDLDELITQLPDEQGLIPQLP